VAEIVSVSGLLTSVPRLHTPTMHWIKREKIGILAPFLAVCLQTKSAVIAVNTVSKNVSNGVKTVPVRVVGELD
jgi:hypothetical protein